MQSKVDKAELSSSVRKALYASKICSYAQGLNIIRAKSISMGWNIEMGELTRIWKVCVPQITATLCFSVAVKLLTVCRFDLAMSNIPSWPVKLPRCS